MTVSPEGLPYRRYRRPVENRRVLVEPPLGEVGRLLAENVRRRSQYRHDFQGRSLPS